MLFLGIGMILLNQSYLTTTLHNAKTWTNCVIWPHSTVTIKVLDKAPSMKCAVYPLKDLC